MTEILDRDSLLPAPRDGDALAVPLDVPEVPDRNALVEHELQLLETRSAELGQKIMWMDRHLAETSDKYTTPIIKIMFLGPVLDEEDLAQRRYLELLIEPDDGSWGFY